MRVTAIQCPKCKDKIFSRAHHDFHYCSCGQVAIDGGFAYSRVLWKDGEPPTTFRINIKQTREQLYNDWNKRKNKYGTIKTA